MLTYKPQTESHADADRSFDDGPDAADNVDAADVFFDDDNFDTDEFELELGLPLRKRLGSLWSKNWIRAVVGLAVIAVIAAVLGTSQSSADQSGATIDLDPISGYPWCQDQASDLIGDSVGDGYGWENNRSCRVRINAGPDGATLDRDPDTGYPWCLNRASDFVGDSIGDGYGWEHDQTCRVQAGSGAQADAVVRPPTTAAAVGPPVSRSPIILPMPAPPSNGPTTTEAPEESPPTEAPINSTTTETTAPAPVPPPPAPQPSPAPPEPTPSTSTPDNPTPAPNDPTFDAIRNDDPKFSQFANVPSNQLSIDALTFATDQPDNGSVGDGQFRIACEYSHFASDDPIVFPGEPGRAHLHMFFGNTLTNAHTTTDSLVNSGGGTCNGFELNRSAYWTPALLDGKGNTIVPDSIIIYYKTKHPQQAQRIPQGLKMLAGNTSHGPFTADQYLNWACGDSGESYNVSNQIPNCNGDTFHATIVFPNCWDGRNLDSSDHKSHLTYVDDNTSCPGSHPVRIPQITFLLYYPGSSSIDGWHISSDRHNGNNAAPGGSLHADWFGGWNDEAMDLWIDGCIRAARNCSYGQTGTNRQLAKLNGRQQYEGPNTLPLPPGVMH